MRQYCLTVALNAAVDVTYSVPGFSAGEIHTAVSVSRAAGGKANNVARVLAKLGGRVVATGFAGGHAGRMIQAELAKAGVAPDFEEIPAESRTCYAISDPVSGRVTELRERGPQLNAGDMERFRSRFERLLAGAALVVISGSLPPGIPATAYRDMVLQARAHRGAVILDSSGEALAQALGARPSLVKPNRSELADWAGTPIDTGPAALAAARRLLEAGPEQVAVSLGAEGMLWVAHGEVWRAVPPAVRAVNTVGSGDSAVAGLAFGLLNRAPMDAAIRLAVACGTANALSPGVGQVDPAEVERLMPAVHVERMV